MSRNQSTKKRSKKQQSNKKKSSKERPNKKQPTKNTPLKKKVSKKTTRAKTVRRSGAARKAAKPVAEQYRTIAPLDAALDSVAVSPSSLTDGQCDNIASDCVRAITGSSRQYSRSDQLQQYGVNSDQQCRAIVNLIISDPDRGVGRYHFKIVDTSKLSGLAPGWTMGQLANTIQSSAIPS